MGTMMVRLVLRLKMRSSQMAFPRCMVSSSLRRLRPVAALGGHPAVELKRAAGFRLRPFLKRLWLTSGRQQTSPRPQAQLNQ